MCACVCALLLPFQELSDEEEEGEGEDGIGVEEEGASNTVRLLKKCLHQNRRFQVSQCLMVLVLQ